MNQNQLKQKGVQNVPLCENWRFRVCETENWLSATVPGSVLGDLLAHKQIEDPFWRTNEYDTRDLFEKRYEYETVFMLSVDTLAFTSACLVCQGLDTLAAIEINGQCVGKSDNMHRTWRFPVRELLHTGENTIRIIFDSPNRYIAQAFRQGDIDCVSAGSMPGNNYLRKSHCMFGWDWGPQLPDAGIFRPIFLEFWNEARLEDVYFSQTHNDGQVTLQVAVSVRAWHEGHTLSCDVTAPDGQTFTSVLPLCAEKGILSLELEHPQLWWPNGYGEHPLYHVCVQLHDASDTLDTFNADIGLRTLTVCNEPDKWGKEFAICVNGIKIFAMGADYIPEDSLLNRITPQRTEKLIQTCIRANFNCLRVWGGGYYPDDFFFDICDRYGILVWQDMMFACNVYEMNDAFEDSVCAELIDNVRRIRHHACLAIWCGNNEMETGWVEWDSMRNHRKKLRADYLYQFEYLFPKLMKQYDPNTFYWNSSPSSGGCFENPNDFNSGDVHYWEVWHGQKPFEDYRNYHFRFCSEFGFQSFPCLKTVESFTLPEDRNIFSTVMESHQKNGTANGKILYYLADNFLYPKDFDSLLYVSQLLQAMAIQYGVEHWRRNRGRCMGAIYWQLNDCWPVASWASVDYFGRWKALHYFAKRFFAPLSASILDEKDRMAVYLHNETLRPHECKISVFIRNTANEILYEREISTQVPALSSIEAFSGNFCSIVNGIGNSCYFDYLVQAEGYPEIFGTALFVKPKHFLFPSVKLDTEINETDTLYEITIHADTYAKFVEIDLAQADGIFSDNYFDITSEQGRRITLLKSDISGGEILNAQDLKQNLRLRCLRDTY